LAAPEKGLGLHFRASVAMQLPENSVFRLFFCCELKYAVSRKSNIKSSHVNLAKVGSVFVSIKYLASLRSDFKDNSQTYQSG